MSVAAVQIGVAVIGAGSSYQARKKASQARGRQAQAQRLAAKKQQRIDDISAQRARVQAAREKRRVLAQAVNTRVSGGTSSSSAAGFEASISSQYSSAVQASRSKDSLISEISIFNNQASAQAAALFSSSARHSGNADLAKAGATIFSML